MSKLDDPAWRKERAKRARRAQLTIDHYITKLADAAPSLTAEQRAKLAALLDARLTGDNHSE